MYMPVVNPPFSEDISQEVVVSLSEPSNQRRVSAHKSEPDVVCCDFKVPLANGCLRSSTCDLSKRRLSQGDAPYWLPRERNGSLDQWQGNDQKMHNGEMDFLLGRAVAPSASSSSHMIRLTEVAPSHTSLLGEEPQGWKMPVGLFSSKKETDVKRHKEKRIRSYYKAQAELITAFEDIDQGFVVEQEMSTFHKPNYRLVMLLSKITLFVNLLLLIAKAVASALSGSISIISSLVDSALDLFSGIIMWWATRQVKNRDPYTYPQGRTKLEPVAVIILSVVMALASLQLLRESVEQIIGLASSHTPLPVVDAVTFAIAGSTIVIKLILWLVCRGVNSSVVQALAQDHRNDVLSNTVAIVCGYLGSGNFQDVVGGIYGFSYTDPGGAILISVYIMYNWWRTGSEQIKMLTGLTARPEFLSQLTWVAFNHHPKIRHIDTVRAFHFGLNYLVEMDIVLPIDMFLQEAHDIGESLQHKLESLGEVERAFVHLDYEFSHNPKSEHKIV